MPFANSCRLHFIPHKFYEFYFFTNAKIKLIKRYDINPQITAVAKHPIGERNHGLSDAKNDVG